MSYRTESDKAVSIVSEQTADTAVFLLGNG